jgi:hypothetical protein
VERSCHCNAPIRLGLSPASWVYTSAFFLPRVRISSTYSACFSPSFFLFSSTHSSSFFSFSHSLAFDTFSCDVRHSTSLPTFTHLAFIERMFILLFQRKPFLLLCNKKQIHYRIPRHVVPETNFRSFQFLSQTNEGNDAI